MKVLSFSLTRIIEQDCPAHQLWRQGQEQSLRRARQQQSNRVRGHGLRLPTLPRNKTGQAVHDARDELLLPPVYQRRLPDCRAGDRELQLLPAVPPA
jgi:hypothetical protein